MELLFAFPFNHDADKIINEKLKEQNVEISLHDENCYWGSIRILVPVYKITSEVFDKLKHENICFCAFRQKVETSRKREFFYSQRIGILHVQSMSPIAQVVFGVVEKSLAGT